MPRASEALFALVDIVRCSKSRTTVDAERCSHLLSRSSVRAEVRDGEVRRLLICGSLGSGYERIWGLD